MSLLTATQLKTLDYAINGQPCFDIAAKTTFPATGTLDYAVNGQPYVAATGTAATATGRPQIFVCT